MSGQSQWESHRRAAQDEDVAWLMERGVSIEEACRRVGLTVAAYEKRHEPARA